MSNPKRFFLAFLIIGVLILSAVLLQALLYENLVLPVSFLMVVVYRVLLSIDQNIYWILFTFSGMLYIFYRWMQQPAINKYEEQARINIFLQRFNYWQTSIHLTHDEIDQPNLLRRDLTLK